MKKFFLGLMAIMVSVTLFAAPRTMEEAAQIAAQFTNQQPRLRMAHKSPRAAANMRLAHKALQNNSEAVAYYVFNQEGNNGFVIVSADDRTAEDVLGYTENGSFDMNTANPNLKWWLERYTKQITALQSKPENAEQPRVRKAVQVTAISNILKNDAGQEIKWSQGTPYNNLCPVDSFDNTRCVTGCVATAASQVMYYYRWPQQGTGSSSYTWDNCTDYEYDEVKHKYNIEECISYTSHTLSANYGQTTYDWNNMKSSYSGSYTQAQGNAVATLMYHAGVASSMEYGGNSVGSGTTTDNMAYGLATYFKYKYTKVIAMYDNIYAVHDDVPFEYNVTANQFKNYFNTELEANRPVIMSGWTAESDGHEFVCCGRDTQNRFYINWGWAGSDNGYFAITSLTPDDCDFSEELDAIIGLQPGAAPVDPFAITWMSNGAQFTTTNSTGTVVLPTTDPAACDGKVFVGWCDQADYASATTAPTFVKAGDAVEEGAIFYAVFAEQSGEGSAPTTVASVTFKSAESDSNTDNSESIAAKLVESATGISAYSGTKLYVGTNGLKLGSSKGTGSITLTLNNTVNVSKVVVNGSQYGTDASSKLKVTAGTTELGSQSPATNMEFTADPAISTNTIKVETTTKRAYISSISVISGAGASYSNYSTSCGGTTAIDNTPTDAKIVKTIENGQLIIIRDNEKYTIFGQKIQ